MIVCPHCNHDNIEGADVCEHCEQPMHEMSLPPPGSEVERCILTERIRELEPRKPLLVAPDAPVLDVLRLLVDHAVGALVVVDADGRAVGVFSERDGLMRLGEEADKLGPRPVSEFMTPDPQTLRADAKIAFAIQMMDQGGYRHVPIVDHQDRVVGIISVRDLLHYITEKMATEETTGTEDGDSLHG